jgi:hypothetical protein
MPRFALWNSRPSPEPFRSDGVLDEVLRPARRKTDTVEISAVTRPARGTPPLDTGAGSTKGLALHQTLALGHGVKVIFGPAFQSGSEST